MKKSMAVTGIVMVVALFWSERAWGQCSCYPDGPAADGTVRVASLVPAPDTPKGPSTGMVGQKLTYKTDGHDPLGVHEF